MMRTIEVLLVIIIITGASLVASMYAVLPQPRRVSPINLRRLALTTLEMLDSDHDLSDTVFKAQGDPAWGQLQTALSACLPPNIVYNLTAYSVTNGANQLYNPTESISNVESLGVGSDASSYLIASSNVTFNVIPEKIGEHGGGGTLYILNCSDSNGWWITGYSPAKLANDLYNLLSPYFHITIVVQNTTQFAQILDNHPLQNETLQNAVIINTCGEAVPIPAGYYMSTNVGYDASRNSYSLYCYTLGQRVNWYNWTWVSIVGWPLYYVSNTFAFSNSQNSWGIFGMVMVADTGLGSFLQGLSNQSYTAAGSGTHNPGLVSLSSVTQYYCNYYGIYPSIQQTSSRALDSSILDAYQLTVTTYVLDPVGSAIPGAVYRHILSGNITGSFMSLGLTRTPDIRLTALGLLCDYKPRLLRSEYTVTGTSLLVVLQLGQVGGV
jgi:hypothetical protein